MTALMLWKYFSSIIDKYGDPGVEDFEFNHHINMAQIMVLKDHFRNIHTQQPGTAITPYGFEVSQYDNEAFRPLFINLELDSNDQGLISQKEIEDKLKAKKPEYIFFKQNNLFLIDGQDQHSVTFVRHNDVGPRRKNFFTAPSVECPFYYGISEGIVVEPRQKFKFNAIVTVYPTEVIYDRAVPDNIKNPILPDSTMLTVLFRALQLYGIQIREQQLYAHVSEQEIKQ